MKNNRFQLAVFGFIVFFIGGIFIMNYLQSALQNTTMILGVDLFPRWVGAQAILDGQSPYSQETRTEIWQTIYGSSETPHGNPFGFYYPPSVATLLFPFLLGGVSLETAAVVWCALLWALWAVFLFLWLIVIEIPYKTRLLPLFLLSGLMFRPAFSNYLLGQYSLFCVLMLILSWFCFKKKYWILGGIFGALALIKISLTALPFALLLTMYGRHWKALVSFGLTSLILYLPPTLILGWWVPDFMSDISRYTLDNAVAWSVVDLKTALGIGWLFFALILLLGGLKFKDFDLAIAAALPLNAIFVPHTADYDLVVFIPLLFLLASRWFTDTKFPAWASILAFSLLLWFPWVSLITFVSVVTEFAVEHWYRFIWLTYPVIILIVAILSKFFLQRIRSLHPVQP